MKAYMYRPIKILQLLARARFQKVLTSLKNILALLTILHVQEIFLYVIPVRIMVPCLQVV